MALVNIISAVPGMKVDLKYATSENFTGQIVYDFKDCYVHQEVALCLKRVQLDLERLGLGLKIWDGFRPISFQWKFWAIIPDERYISDPRKGGRHTRGTAVDVTLVDAVDVTLADQDGVELLMLSTFDDFSEKAHRNFLNAPEVAIRNRELLEKSMHRHGFEGLLTEW